MTPFGELDLWVTLGRRSYLAEIKTRTHTPQDLITSGLTHRKFRQMKLIRACICAAQPHPWHRYQLYCSFILLIPKGIFWIPDIFDPNPVVSAFTKGGQEWSNNYKIV